MFKNDFEIQLNYRDLTAISYFFIVVDRSIIKDKVIEGLLDALLSKKIKKSKLVPMITLVKSLNRNRGINDYDPRELEFYSIVLSLQVRIIEKEAEVKEKNKNKDRNSVAVIAVGKEQ